MTKREIKFRAFDETDESMYYLLSFDDMMRLEIMQYTGLKDNKGNDIYEDDILKDHGIVAWNDVEHQWSVIDLNWNDRREWHDIDYLTSPFEIIGNIHENPELLI